MAVFHGGITLSHDTQSRPMKFGPEKARSWKIRMSLALGEFSRLGTEEL